MPIEAATPSWHGWGMEGVTLSVAPSPDNARAVALILSNSDGHRVLGEFFSEWDAQDCMNFLDAAFKVTADANTMLAQRIVELGG